MSTPNNNIDLIKNVVQFIRKKYPYEKVLKISEDERERIHFDLMLELSRTDPIAFVLHHEGIREWGFHYFNLVAFDDEDED
jgi:hypothetical protein